MKKILIFSIIFMLAIFSFIPYAKASSVSMNLTSNDEQIENDTNNQNYFNDEANLTNTDTNTNTMSNSLTNNISNATEFANNAPVSNVPTVTRTTSSSEGFLTTENILSVIIIVIGIILIFLGIAIIIRCR